MEHLESHERMRIDAIDFRFIILLNLELDFGSKDDYAEVCF
jgi:hypothetical protein